MACSGMAKKTASEGTEYSRQYKLLSYNDAFSMKANGMRSEQAIQL